MRGMAEAIANMAIKCKGARGGRGPRRKSGPQRDWGLRYCKWLRYNAKGELRHKKNSGSTNIHQESIVKDAAAQDNESSGVDFLNNSITKKENDEDHDRNGNKGEVVTKKNVALDGIFNLCPK